MVMDPGTLVGYPGMLRWSALDAKIGDRVLKVAWWDVHVDVAGEDALAESNRVLLAMGRCYWGKMLRTRWVCEYSRPSQRCCE